MIVHEGKEVTSSVQYYAVNKSDCGKTSMTVHGQKEVTSLVQCFNVNESDCGKTNMIGYEGQ